MAESLIHEILPVGWLQCNCSVLGDAATREAIVLDPGDEVERILEILARHQLTVRAIVNTHAHIDHVGGLRKLHDATGAPVLMHSADLELYRALETQAAWIGMPVPEMTDVDGLLREGDEVRWGRYAASVIHTPGHTLGSLCLHLPWGRLPRLSSDVRAAATLEKGTVHVEPSPNDAGNGILFAGDTLFAGSIGRTDLWGGSFEEIMRSLQTKLMAFPDETLVFPGHGPSTSIGRERESNPFLRVPYR